MSAECELLGQLRTAIEAVRRAELLALRLDLSRCGDVETVGPRLLADMLLARAAVTGPIRVAADRLAMAHSQAELLRSVLERCDVARAKKSDPVES